MNFFTELNRLEVKYDTAATRTCYKELVTLFTDYLQNLEKQLKRQAKKAFVVPTPRPTKSLLDQVKETGGVYDFGEYDAFIRECMPAAVEQVEADIKQYLADSKLA